ncbi:MAG: diacylglycerol/polyprenol kinase family protein [Erysipelotrichaceae bacterium]
MNEYVGLALSFAYLGIILLISLKLQKIPFEFSRKFVHILAANWWFIAVYAFHSPWMASIVPFFFVIFNSVTYFFGWIPSINKQDGQRNFGTIYYAISTLFLTFISFQPGALQTVGGLGILVMGYGDGLASLVGRKWGSHPFQIFQAKKSFEGSTTMFLVSFIVIYTYLTYATGNAAIGACLLVASVATLVEAICPWGLDNLLVPMMTSFVYFVYML